MGNRIGVIFHNNWEEFSPLLYSHYGADLIPIQLQEYLREYIKINDINNHDGHKYNPNHMIVGFIQSLDKDIHMRVENLSQGDINLLVENHELPNCFDNGCWIINISTDDFGNTVFDSNNYYLENNNIVNDEMEINNY